MLGWKVFGSGGVGFVQRKLFGGMGDVGSVWILRLRSE